VIASEIRASTFPGLELDWHLYSNINRI